MPASAALTSACNLDRLRRRQPLSGVAIADATQEGARLATTDESGAATFTLDTDVRAASATSGGGSYVTTVGIGAVFGSLIIGYPKNP